MSFAENELIESGRLLFDHLPKCGGMTVNKNLESAYPADQVFTTSGGNPMDSINYFKSLNQKDRWSYRLISGHLTNELFAQVHPRTKKITMLRNPTDRVISLFNHAKRDESHYLYKYINSNQLTIVDFDTLPTVEVKNWYVFHFSGMNAVQIKNSPKESLELACENILNNYNIVGFQNNMKEFLDCLEVKFNIHMKYKESFINKAPNSTVDINNDILTKIAEKNSLDVELFNRLNCLKRNGLIINSDTLEV